MYSHEIAVKQIAATVRDCLARGQRFRINHGSTNSTRPAHNSQTVDISMLKNVLEVNKDSKTAIVEPNVPMDKLVQATLAHVMKSPVVMEFPGITVGGGFAGIAGESSSFRYGYFDQTVKSIEMVLATGEVLQASPSVNPDLFRGAAGTAGTLGIITKLELALIPAKTFVRLEYHRFNTVPDTLAAVRDATRDPNNDYVDGILFSQTPGVVMIGRLTNDIPSSTRIQTFSGPWDPWFYLHSKERATSHHLPSGPPTDHIPLPEYLFRYDRGAFWMGTQAFSYFPLIPFNRLTRWFLNDFMHTRMLYRALQGSGVSTGQMVQDLALPYHTAEAFIDYTAERLGIWPLWLCPLRGTPRPTFHPSYCGEDDEGVPEPMINIGVWGKAAEDVDVFLEQNRELERKLTQLSGRKVLYSHTYYTEDEFWTMYDRAWYDRLREKNGATTLPNVYDKVHVEVGNGKMKGVGGWRSRWPVPGVCGIHKAIFSRDYLIHRQPCWTYWEREGLSPGERE